MRKIWLLAGQAFFWLTLPALFVYLLFGKRTRVILRVGEEFLAVKAWHGSGRWQLPGGGLHRGEPSITGALRELVEETGITLADHDLALVQADVRSQGWLRFRFDVYAAQLAAKPQVMLQRSELVDYTWLPLNEGNDALMTDVAQSLQTWQSQR
jgi:8-oxo-dGTP pyrophosphatase MutT (NUDIX family)